MKLDKHGKHNRNTHLWITNKENYEYQSKWKHNLTKAKVILRLKTTKLNRKHQTQNSIQNRKLWVQNPGCIFLDNITILKKKLHRTTEQCTVNIKEAHTGPDFSDFTDCTSPMTNPANQWLHPFAASIKWSMDVVLHQSNVSSFLLLCFLSLRTLEN